MILRISILIFAILAHTLTPRWFLSDFLTIGDWMMIFFGLLSFTLYKLAEKDEKVFMLSLLLSLSVLIYFVTSAEMIIPDVGIDRIVYRWPVIFNSSIDIPMNTGRFLEMFNAAQLVFNTIISFLFIIRFYKKQFMKRTLQVLLFFITLNMGIVSCQTNNTPNDDMSNPFREGKIFTYKEVVDTLNDNDDYIEGAINKEYQIKVLKVLTKKDTSIIFLSSFFPNEIFNDTSTPETIVCTSNTCYSSISSSWKYFINQDLAELNIKGIVDNNFTLLCYDSQEYNRALDFEDSIDHPFLISINNKPGKLKENKNRELPVYTFERKTSHSTITYKFSITQGFIEYDFDYGGGVARNGKFTLINSK